jgi:hypothetical protein
MDGRRWSVAPSPVTMELEPSLHRSVSMSSSSTPVTILAILGAVIAVLGLFIAGNIVMVSVGLVAVFGAGLLDVIAIRRVRS